MERMLSIAEVARRINRCHRVAWRHVARGTIPSVPVVGSRERLVPESALKNLELPRGGRPKTKTK
jgi:hypothetical protein